MWCRAVWEINNTLAHWVYTHMWWPLYLAAVKHLVSNHFLKQRLFCSMVNNMIMCTKQLQPCKVIFAVDSPPHYSLQLHIRKAFCMFAAVFFSFSTWLQLRQKWFILIFLTCSAETNLKSHCRRWYFNKLRTKETQMEHFKSCKDDGW